MVRDPHNGDRVQLINPVTGAVLYGPEQVEPPPAVTCSPLLETLGASNVDILHAAKLQDEREQAERIRLNATNPLRDNIERFKAKQSTFKYARDVSERMAEKLSEYASDDNALMSLADEITLQRYLVGQCLAALETAQNFVVRPNNASETAFKNQQVMLTKIALDDAIEKVGALVERAARIDASRNTNGGRLTAAMVSNIVSSMSTLLDETLIDGTRTGLFTHEAALTLSTTIATKLQTSADGLISGPANGLPQLSRITPDTIVMEMDSTIPRVASA